MSVSAASRDLRHDCIDTEISISLFDENTQPLTATVDMPVQSVREITVGTVLRSRYVLEQVIGQGGDSIVFRAQDQHRASAEDGSERRVAIKVLLPEQRLNPNALMRLQREFRQMQLLTHPAIARVFDLDCDGDIWFMSMELVAGQTVHAWLQTGAHIEQRLQLIRRCCEALEHAHSLGIIHGDLKPSNVLVSHDGAVKLIDFGSAPVGPSGTGTSQVMSAAATVSYASPEVLAGELAEVRDDLFSLSCLSYMILSKGKHPFGGLSALAAARVGACPAPLAGFPAHLGEVLRRGLALERGLRPASVREFVHELRDADPSPFPEPSSIVAPLPDEPAPSPDDEGGVVVVAATPSPLVTPAVVPAAMSPAVSAVTSARTRSKPGRYRLSERRATLVGLAVMILGAAVLVLQALNRSAVRPAAHVPQLAVAAPIRTPEPAVAEQPVPSQPDVAVPAVPAAQPVARPSGTITFDRDAMSVTGAQSMVAIPLKRLRSTRGSASVAWAIEGGTAEPGVDYEPTRGNVIRFIEGQPMRSIFIPLKQGSASAAARRPRTIVVALRRVTGGVAVGPVSRTTITLARDPLTAAYGQAAN